MGYLNLTTSTVLGLAAGCITLTTIGCLILKKKKQQNATIPENIEWKHVGHVAEITIYPVRSGAAMTLQLVHCNKDGLYSEQGVRDRSLILLNDEDKIACADVYPNMLKIKSEILNENVIRVKSVNMPDIELHLDELKQSNAKQIKQYTGFKMHLVEANAEHHEWFSKVVLERSSGFRLFIQTSIETEQSFWGAEKKAVRRSLFAYYIYF